MHILDQGIEAILIVIERLFYGDAPAVYFMSTSSGVRLDFRLASVTCAPRRAKPCAIE